VTAFGRSTSSHYNIARFTGGLILRVARVSRQNRLQVQDR